jgi:6-pyruvoyltetrahydropterin/6-carboxytetrahydropterin synthase
MIIDFGVLKSLVGTWIQDNWDHTAILMEGDADPAVSAIARSNANLGRPVYFMSTPPTAEYLALELARVSKELLRDTGIQVVRVLVRETPNCFAEWNSSIER